MAYACKILAIDGGGIRGVIPAYILQQLEAALGKPIYQCFDVIAGTSTGGLIGMALTTPIPGNGNPPAPLSATNILNLYLKDEDQIFVPQPSSYGFAAEYYSIAPWLQKIFGGITLSQAQQQLKSLGNPMPKQVLATGYTLNAAPPASIGPYLFNWSDAAASANDNYCVWEATLGTSSAPTYFPLAEIGVGVTNGSNALHRWVADGGVVANNPALYAVSWATQNIANLNLGQILVVSLGTGLYNAGTQIPTGPDIQPGNWGSAQWLLGTDTNGESTKPLITVLAMSNELAPDQQLQQLIAPAGGSYNRLEPLLPYSESQLDGTDTADLLKTAIAYIGAGGPGYSIYQSVLSALQAS